MSTDELELIFSRWSRRYRLQRGIRWGVAGLVFGLSAGLGFSLVALSQKLLLRNEFMLISSGIGVAVAAIAVLAGYFLRLKRETAAQTFDRIFNLQERVSTAFELQAGKLPSSIPQEIIERQLQDTLDAARRVEPRIKLSFGINRMQLILSCLLILAIALVGLRGEQFFQVAQTQRAVQQAINQEIEQIEALEQQIESDTRLTPEQQEELLQTLEDAKQGLQDSQDAEQAVSVLTSTQEKLTALSNAQEQSQALREVGQSLSQQEGSPLQQVGEDLASNDILAAAQELANIDISSLDQQEQQDLAQQLQEAAEALESTNQELAEQLNSAAQALQQGDVQTASQALQEAAQNLGEVGQQIAQSEAASQAAEKVGQGKDQILQAGQGASGPPSETGQAGQGTGNTSGSNSGQGQSQSNQGGSGAGKGEGNGSSQGPEAGSQPIDQGNGPGDGGERPYDLIYAPTRLGGQNGDRVILPESGEAGEQITGTGDTLPGETGMSSVPYVDVYTYYAEIYRQAISSGQIPTAYSELVRQYFMSLEP